MSSNNKSWIATAEEDPITGETILNFPEDMMLYADWQEGDTLRFTMVDDSCIIVNETSDVRKNNKLLSNNLDLREGTERP